MEHMLQDFARAYGMRYAALRYFNAAGASREGDLGEVHVPETHLIPLVLQVALGQREKIQVFGDDYPTPDGTCIRDYVHVEDLADAHLRALDYLSKGGASTAVNLGTGRGHSVREVIETVADVVGKPVPQVEQPRRAGDPPELVAEPSRAREVLGWIPTYPDLRTIVEHAWRWHSTRA